MLGEGFLRVLLYREERKFSSRRQKTQANSQCNDALNSAHRFPNSTDLQTESAEAGKKYNEML